MMIFTYQYNKSSPKVVVKIPGQDVTLREATIQFELFLKAAGYYFDGELDFVSDQKEANNVNS